jgi:aspartate-semialdehyde dehydrogenase
MAVVGATGAVGSTMLEVMARRGLPAAEVVPLASERSAGREVRCGDRTLTVRVLTEDEIGGFDVALFSAGSSVSREWAPRFAERGCVVIDNSSAWRMEEHVPLVIAEVNPAAIDSHQGIVANPNCSTMQMVMALKPIHDEATIERVVVSTYQSTSGTGQAAVQELRDQARSVLDDREVRKWRRSRTATTTPPRSAR